MAKNAVKPHSAEPSAAVHAAAGDALLSLATDVTSVAQTTPSAASNVADARGDTPREDDPSLAVDYECESDDMADLGRVEQSPDYLQAADYEPSKKRAYSVVHATDMYRSMFGSDDEDDPPTPVYTPKHHPHLFLCEVMTMA